MLTLAITLTMVGLALLALGIRGRITARGTFCRRCRFDLRGITPPVPPVPSARCPECGRPSDRPRTVLRRPSPALIVIASLMLTVGVVLIAGANPRVAARVAANSSDRTLLWLLRLHIPAAHDEARSRLSGTQTLHPVLAATLDEPLERVLTQGRDAPLNDQRLILAALAGAQLTPLQAERLFEAAISVELAARVRAHPHQDSVPVGVRFRNNLINYFHQDFAMLSGGIAYSAEWGLDTGGPRDQTELFQPDDRVTFEQSSLQFVGGSFVGTAGRSPFRSRRSVVPPPGSEFPIIASAEVRLTSPRSTAPLAVWRTTIEQTVTIVDPSMPLVDTRRDDAAYQALLERLRLTIVTVNRGQGTPEDPQVLFALVQHSESIPADASYRATLITQSTAIRSSEPFMLQRRPMAAGVSSQAHQAFQYVQQSPTDQTIQSFLEAGTADLWLIPDPASAYEDPFIETCLAGDLIFRSVRVLPSINYSPRPVPTAPEPPNDSDTRPD
jgi:hypothetical protein